MNQQEAAQNLTLRYRLSPEQGNKLMALAAPMPTAPAVRNWFWRVVAVLAAALGGLGVIMWVAANWESFGRFGRFALLQAIVLVMAVGAAWKLRTDAPPASAASGLTSSASSSAAAWAMSLVVFMCIGGLFAYFGQTYQTGADPWQLFALWAALALPLCVALRSDVLWTPWVLVAATGVSLWLNAHMQHSWRVDVDNFDTYLMACLGGIAVIAVVGPWLKRWTGAGMWSLRMAVTLTLAGLIGGGLGGLFNSNIAPQYMLALAACVLGVAALIRRKWFDVYALSVLLLGLIVLLMAGLVRMLFNGSNNDWFSSMFILALAAAGMLAGAVRLIMTLQTKYKHIAQAKPASVGDAA